MNKQAYLEEIYNSAFEDELEKISAGDVLDAPEYKRVTRKSVHKYLKKNWKGSENKERRKKYSKKQLNAGWGRQMHERRRNFLVDQGVKSSANNLLFSRTYSARKYKATPEAIKRMGLTERSGRGS